MKNPVRKPRETDATKEEQQHEKKVVKFKCEICLKRRLSSRIFPNGGLCVHFFCLDCIAKYVEVKVEGMEANIICPALNCNYPLDPLSCKPIIGKAIFHKWCDLLCQSAVLASGGCYCPYQDCSALFLNECGDKLTKTKCPNCKKSFCFQCNTPCHTEYQCRCEREQNDLLSMELIKKKKWTRCYNCGHAVERIKGCREVKCICRKRFCHDCGERYHDGFCNRLCHECGERHRFGSCNRLCHECGERHQFGFCNRLCHECGESHHFGSCKPRGDFTRQFYALWFLIVAAYGIHRVFR